jgi:hypothetical protein
MHLYASLRQALVGLADRAGVNGVKALRTLALLALLGFLSFAAVSDQPSRGDCGPFILNQSALGGCAWLT